MSNFDNNMSVCGNCGKGEEESVDLKKCVACKMVKYCSRDCQIAHRPQHKKACKKRAAELHDEKLFADPPPPEECPICLLTLPINDNQSIFKTCCGKRLCLGCVVGMLESEGKDVCAFCRTPNTDSSKESIQRLHKLMDNRYAEAFFVFGSYYEDGYVNVPQDYQKANELYLKAGELGCARAYSYLGNSYRVERGVERDNKKSKHYWELAAMGGDINARHNLGCLEEYSGNQDRAMKHFVISAKAGLKESLNSVQQGYLGGFVTKDQYASSLRAHQQRQNEMKSDERDKAALKLLPLYDAERNKKIQDEMKSDERHTAAVGIRQKRFV